MIHTFLETAIAIAHGAGQILNSATAERTADFKLNETDLVTEYDRRSESYIVSALQQAFPDHAVHGEEGSRVNSGAEYEWLIDPIDGTTNFAHGLPIFCASLALEVDGAAQVAAVYDPTRRE
jgi:myo-inositol-1(or 4)-monophosphatase